MFCLKVDDEIVLGLLEERHAQLLLDLNEASREHLRKWLPHIGNLNTVEETRQFILTWLKRFSENNGFLAGIFYNDELAGCSVFRYYDWNVRQTEIGYWLGQPFTGRGIITRSTRKMVKYAFEELKMNRVEIRCATGNVESRAVPERLGFMQEGLLRQAFWKYDHWLDTAVYSMLASDWKSHQ